MLLLLYRLLTGWVCSKSWPFFSAELARVSSRKMSGWRSHAPSPLLAELASGSNLLSLCLALALVVRQ